MDERTFEAAAYAMLNRMMYLERELEAYRTVVGVIEQAMIYPSASEELAKARRSPLLTEKINEKYKQFFSRLVPVLRGDCDRELLSMIDSAPKS